MRNLDWLYKTNDMFRETVNQGAAQWMGSDSPVFAGEWILREHEYEHHDSDYEDLTGQHLDGPCVVPDGFCSDAAKLQISQFVEQETWKTAESDATKSEMRDFDDNRDEQVDMLTDFVVAKMEERKLEMLMEHCADQAEQLRRLTDENAELRKLAEKYRAGSIAAQDEAEAWRAKCGALLDAAHEMVRIGGDVA